MDTRHMRDQISNSWGVARLGSPTGRIGGELALSPGLDDQRCARSRVGYEK